MAFDQAAFNAQWFPGTDPATGQPLQTGGSQASAASTRVAPWQYGQGTNYATGLQNTLQPMMNTMYPNGYLPGFSESFYLANNPDVRNASWPATSTRRCSTIRCMARRKAARPTR